jgi:NAD(P)-dependent dehydrogenase (short-subunit alcohol dehydrogenase family)
MRAAGIAFGVWLAGFGLCATAAAQAPAAVPGAAAQAGAQKAVLVTGASSGIGHAIAVRLAADGYFVYAGVRKDAEARALSGIRNLEPLKLDVTDPRQIAAAVVTVRQAGRGLYGLVNNAGIGSFAPVINPPRDEFDRIMAVNAVAPYRMVQAFGPLVVKQKGRIITIGSIGGFVALADSSAYSMSKFAVEALTDSLAEELAPQGVGVSIIEPGTYKTRINENAMARGQASNNINPAQNGDPDQVARVVERVLAAAHPLRRYLTVPNRWEAQWALRAAADRLVQLNEGQPYTYDHARMLELLEDSLAHKPPPPPPDQH